VDAGQVPVQHDHVVVVDHGTVEAGRAVERDVDGHPVAAQPDGDGLRHLRVVVDHEHSHVLRMPRDRVSRRFPLL
jgi:hypothetical protein